MNILILTISLYSIKSNIIVMSNIRNNNTIYRIHIYSEVFTFIIAILTVSIFAVLLYIYFPTDQKIAQGIFTGFMAWIGSIIGFYFGQRPVREVLTRLQESEKDITEKVNKATESLTYSHELSELIKDVRTIVEDKDKDKK